MPLQLDEEESAFFSAALSFLDDLPPAAPPPHRFEELPDDARRLAHVSDGSAGPGPSDSHAPLDAAELQGLAELCLPPEPSSPPLELSESTSWDVALLNISSAFAPVPPPSPPAAATVAASMLTPTPTLAPMPTAQGGRPRASSRARTRPATDKAPAKDKGKAKSHLPYNPNKARDERKLELLYLRKKVKEMEAQLEALHAHGSQGPDADRRAPSAASTTPGVRRKRLLGATAGVDGEHVAALAPSALPSVWKELCLRQLQRRVKAERENARLKRELESQIKVAKGMEKLLNKPSGGKVDKTQNKRARSVHVPPTDPSADAAIFDELIAGVEASYHDVDAVLQEIGLSDLETARRGAHVREGEHGLFLDIFANSVLPFDMGSTGEAVWEYFKGLRKHRGPLYHKTMRSLEPTEDTIIENFALELFANNTRADFRIRQVVKRFVEERRVLVVWTAHVEPIAVANDLFSGLGFREKAYVVCTRPPSTADSPSADTFTLLQRCLRITPHAVVKHEHARPSGSLSSAPHGTRGLDRATVGALTEFVLSLCAADMAADQELIENVLVDQAINRHNTTRP